MVVEEVILEQAEEVVNDDEAENVEEVIIDDVDGEEIVNNPAFNLQNKNLSTSYFCSKTHRNLPPFDYYSFNDTDVFTIKDAAYYTQENEPTLRGWINFLPFYLDVRKAGKAKILNREHILKLRLIKYLHREINYTMPVIKKLMVNYPDAHKALIGVKSEDMNLASSKIVQAMEVEDKNEAIANVMAVVAGEILKELQKQQEEQAREKKELLAAIEELKETQKKMLELRAKDIIYARYRELLDEYYRTPWPVRIFKKKPTLADVKNIEIECDIT